MSDHRLVYITTPTLEDAHAIGRALVEDRMAACVNLIPNMTSMYRWQGEIQEDSEVVLIAKTQASKMAELTNRVKELHPADVPCVVALPLMEGNPAFFSWLVDETA